MKTNLSAVDDNHTVRLNDWPVGLKTVHWPNDWLGDLDNKLQVHY